MSSPLPFTGKKVAILGFGVNNRALVPYLLARGAKVTICDQNPDLPQEYAEATYRLGPDAMHRLEDFEVIFRTPGIPFLSPEIQAAKQAGVRITSQTQLFLELCPARTVGVTGTKGKGTTASLIAAMLERAKDNGEIIGNVYLGGNIGSPVIDLLDRLTEQDWVILELSSFQLQDMTVSPHIAVVLNVTSDHLDHHASVEEYREAKKSIVRYQTAGDYAVVYHDSPLSMSFLDATPAEPYLFSGSQPVDFGVWVEKSEIKARFSDHGVHAIAPISDVKIVGNYNLENVTAACTAAALAGASFLSIRQGLAQFSGLPHRLEFVAEKNRVRYFDDSKATTSDSTIAAIQAFTEPVVLIVGGSSKGADYTELIKIIAASPVETVIAIGQEGARIRQLLQDAKAPQKVLEGKLSMPEIVQQAADVAPPGSVVLLSPAAASFDMFKNAEDRGEQFQTAVRQLSDTGRSVANQPEWLHFIGIKGVGMSALAIVARGLGYRVTGSDVDEEFITDASLREAGISPQVGFAAEHIDPAIDVIVLGAAYGSDNPEVKAATEFNLKTMTYSQMLGYLSKDKKLLAVSGTHGKTTTASLLSYLLYKADQRPSWVIGTGHIKGLPSHGYAGSGDYFVAEVDEYKRAADDPTPKFFDVTPHAAVITSIEHDHPDVFASLDDVKQAFAQFTARVAADGFFVVNGDDPVITSLMASVPSKQVTTFGFSESADYTIIPTKTGFSLKHGGESVGDFTLQLPGKHNAANATAALLVANKMGVPFPQLAEILPAFENVERRFQLVGHRGNTVVIDDYAHHPTAVQVTLEATKQQYPDLPVYCYFQPHTFSRTQALLTEFSQAFKAADYVVITDIFGSAREQAGTITAQDLANETAKHHDHVLYVPFDGLLAHMQHTVPDRAVLITMGAGNIYKLGQKLVEGNP